MVAVRCTSAPGGSSSFPFVLPSTFRPRISRMATVDDSTPAATPSPVCISFCVSFSSVTSLVSSDVSLVSVSSLTSVSPAPSAPACASCRHSGPPQHRVPARLHFYPRDRGKSSSSRFFFFLLFLFFLSNFLDLGFFLVSFFFHLVLPRNRRYRAVSRAFSFVGGSLCRRKRRSRRLVSFFWWFFPLLASFSVSLSKTWLLFSLDLVSFVSSFSFSGLGGWRHQMGHRSGNTCELWLRHSDHVWGCCCWGPSYHR